MTELEVNKFEKTQSQIEGLYKEIGILSRKSPNDAVNKFKLKFINQLLIEANNLLTGIYKPLEGFEIFEEDDLPSNSDVTFIFEQYLNCLEKLRGDNVIRTSINAWCWLVDGNESTIKTSAPKKLKN
ncbi:hypothetical protein [Wenyingzhuangia aestuarii]|uniref:hypothetical protein n=1 Tax=Wenyingzhuangia aestuarii TaxID=1647582 RepID=UPI00143B2F85|nr:hypothetical protein [Wenyingzhuangia aestuarii]NJB84215.1 hypothetical protein [Wenyingzhuangia aestuarii]